MKNLYMSYYKLKEIFDECNIDELNSFGILLTCVEGYDLENTNNAYKDAYEEKISKLGGSKSDYSTIMSNFDITGIIELIDVYNQNEINYFKRLLQSAIGNLISNDKVELEIMHKLLKNLDQLSIMTNNLDELEYKLNEDELTDLFNKYNFYELEAFDKIFEYVFDYDLYNIVEIKDEVLREKDLYAKQGDDYILNMSKKNKKLSNKELRFLIQLLDNSCYNLVSDMYKYRLNDKYHKDLETSISNLHESMLEEMDNRKQKRK